METLAGKVSRFLFFAVVTFGLAAVVFTVVFASTHKTPAVQATVTPTAADPQQAISAGTELPIPKVVPDGCYNATGKKVPCGGSGWKTADRGSWGIGNADAFLNCASMKTRWTHSELRDTYIIMEDSLRGASFTPHQAQAFVVQMAFAATAKDMSLADMRQGMSQIFEAGGSKGKPGKKAAAALDEAYARYAAGCN